MEARLGNGSRPICPPRRPLVRPEAASHPASLRLSDPTTLILVDEADRPRMASLEQVHAIFEAGEIGVILIGMPGLENA
jgi:DNA transposition AAA+ family ATPase